MDEVVRNAVDGARQQTAADGGVDGARPQTQAALERARAVLLVADAEHALH